MRYVLLLYEEAAAARATTRDQAEDELRKYAVLTQELAASHELVGGEAFLPAADAIRVRVDNDTVVEEHTPAPEVELGGFILVECDEARAVEIARRVPVVHHGFVEVRPLLELSTREFGEQPPLDAT